MLREEGERTILLLSLFTAQTYSLTEKEETSNRLEDYLPPPLPDRFTPVKRLLSPLSR